MEKKGVRSVRRAITGEEFQAFEDNVCWDRSVRRVIRGILAEKEREERLLYVSVDGRGDGYVISRARRTSTVTFRNVSELIRREGGGMTDVRVIRDGEALSMIRDRRCKPVGRRDEAHVRGPCLLALP